MTEQINKIAEIWWSWMWPMFWQVGVLIVLIATVDFFIKRWAWPQVRYALWFLVLIKLVLPPSLTSPASLTSQIPLLVKKAVQSRITLPEEPARITTNTTPTEPFKTTSYQDLLSTAPTTITRVVTTEIAGSKSTKITPVPVTLSWKVYGFMVWLLGAAFLSSWLILRLRRLRKENLNNSGEALPDWFENLLDQMAQRLKLRRLPEIVLSGKVCCPATFGVFRPVLLMPKDKVANLSKTNAEHILLHELAHIKRGDLFVHSFYMILQIVYWFNPLLWLIRTHLQNLRELCCDATVARILRENTFSYRETLLETAKQLLTEPVDPGLGLLGLFENSKRLADRLKWLEKKTWKNRPRQLATIIALVGVMLGCVLPMARATKGEAAVASEGIEVVKGISSQAGQETKVRTESPRPSSVRGKVTDIKLPFTFTIYTLTPDGKPQPGVKIRCLHPRAERGAAIVDMVVTSDEKGIAKFSVTQADIITDRYFWFSLGDDRFVGDCGVGISPVDNEYTYTFRALPAEEFRFLVLDENGKPIPKVKLWLTADHPRFPRVDRNMFRASSIVHGNAEGLASVRFAQVKTNIVASAEDHASTFIRGVSLPKEEPYEIRLSVGYNITGKVIDAKNNPVGNVKILAKKKDFIMSYTDEFILKAATDTEGKFVLENASEGTYEIQAQIQDPYQPLYAKAVSVRVEGNGPVADVKLLAEPGAVLKGRYVTKHKLRTANRRIMINTFSPTRSHWEAKTDDEGSFVVSGLPSDAHGSIDFIGVSGFAESVKMSKIYPFFEVERDRIRFRDVPPGVYEGVELHFLLAAKASGQVVDSSGKPLPGLRIIVRPGGRIYKTNSKGEYTVEIPPEEDVSIEVIVPSLQQTIYQSERFRIREGETVEKNFTISGKLAKLVEQKHGFVLAGRVLTEDNKPVTGATVYLGNTYITPDSVVRRRRDEETSSVSPTWEDGLSRPAYLQSEPDGSFSFNLLLPGKTDVWAEHPKWGWAWVRDVSTDAKGIELKLRRQPEKIRLSGKVIDVDEEPVKDAKILIYERGDDSLIAQTKSNAKGRYEIEVAPPWSHSRQLTLLCVPKSRPPAWRIVPYCSAKDVQMKLKRETKVSGRIVNSKGEVIANATVRLYRADDEEFGGIGFFDEMAEVAPSAHTNVKGNFVIEKIPVGSSVSFRAEHANYGGEYAWRILASGEGTRIVDIQLPDGITIEGTVRFADTNETAQGITVRAMRLGKTLRQAVTDTNGNYSLHGLGRRGFYEILLIQAEGPGKIPEWGGQATIEKELKPGDHLTDIDIYLGRPLAFRQKSWRTRRGKAVEGYLMAVLDDSDPAYKGKENYEDTVTLYGSSGKQQWQVKALNTCQTVGANHAMAYNPLDKTIWCVESVGDRLIKLGLDGKVVLEKKDMKPKSLAVDPKTGDVWVLTSEKTIYGKNLIVLSSSGEKIHDWDHRGFDIAYSEKDDCFWLVGKKVLKLNRKGEVIFERPDEFAWLAVSVSVNGTDGSAWVLERRHSQVKGSQNRIWVFEPDGEVRREIDLNNRSSGCVALDSQHGFAWVATSQGLLKLSLDGEIVADIPIQGFSVGIEPDTGYVWVSGREGLYRLDRNGDLVWSKETPGGSQKWLCVIPQ